MKPAYCQNGDIVAKDEAHRLRNYRRAMLEWDGSTGVIPRPHRKPTRNNACVLFCRMSEVTGGLITPFPIFPIPDFPTIVKFLTPKRPETHL
uniref:SFRICE_009869 n=1 Tax=Spodoptera frugiperda TaxID=7108 RepID=A0A2H1W2N6_SPOFR